MLKKLLYTLCAYFLTIITGYAQTFNGPGGTINDLANNYFDLNVSGLPAVLDTTFGLESVCIDIAHTRTGELELFLIAPDGTRLELSTGNGGFGDDYTNTCFDDASVSYIQNGDAPFTGIFHPEGAISYVNNGQSGNGLWRLRVTDYANGGTGDVISWQLNFGTAPPTPFSSNLPIIKLITDYQVIPDDPKILARMEIIDNGPGVRNYITDSPNAYDGFIGIEIRGSSSQQFPKKSYGFETTDSLLNDTNVTLLGLPSESDWILNASYSDKTFIRNVLAYNISQQMGHYASRWRYCELFRDGQYRGIYILTEKIKRDNNRVDIANLTAADTSGDDLTGGYILKIDKISGSEVDGWTSAFPPAYSAGANPFFQYEYPDSSDILPVQKAYIQNYVDSFEIILDGPGFADPITGYRSRIDVNTFIDFFLVNEVSKNVDGYRISTFFHKDKDSNGGLLKMGPVWDYDISWGNADYYNGFLTTGWSYQFYVWADEFQVPFWWDRFLQDPQFTGELKCRWEVLRPGLLSTPNLFTFIDSIALEIDEAQQRNFQRWPILGEYVWPNPMPFPPDYQGVIDELKNYLSARMTLLDSIMPGVCFTSAVTGDAHPKNIHLFPNPAKDAIHIGLTGFNQDQVLQLQIFSVEGKLVRELSIDKPVVAVTDLISGIYIFEFSDGQTHWRKKVIVNNGNR